MPNLSCQVLPFSIDIGFTVLSGAGVGAVSHDVLTGEVEILSDGVVAGYKNAEVKAISLVKEIKECNE
ncbi:hypothetical protein RhiirA4_476921 [Rhizophagus irregularis]|uniref:Uncharacterized protein n=1 Tax=Rhizophagus irregularis TaxID=588596 RepID=A0A2I1HCC0_9GLOM|nr:hypothetical protein RhiirA4_476921 [Rhizophagus irregularis]